MKKNILVFPCGSEIGLEICRSMRLSTHFTLWGGSSVADHGKFEFVNYIDGLPMVYEEDFVQKLNDVIRRYQIDLIMPAYDSVIDKLAEHREEVACRIVMSPSETCRIACSKGETYRRLKGVVPVPRVYGKDEDMDMPVFLKPDAGCGSRGCRRAESPEEVRFEMARNPSLLALEYLPGREYTVDCFTDRRHRLLYVQGRCRARISNGISVNSHLVDDPRFHDLAVRINAAIEFRGAWFFQVKERADGELVLMEIAPRIAGTMELNRGLGVNLPMLSAFDACDMDVSILPNGLDVVIDRALHSRFRTNAVYDTVYVDLDDTLVVDGKVNSSLMAFLYQARNELKRIVLLSRHAKDIGETLSASCISPALFSEIIHLKDRQDRKSAHIRKGERAVFIDDSFSERLDVLKSCGVPSFGPESVDVLQDGRSV